MRAHFTACGATARENEVGKAAEKAGGGRQEAQKG
jgi:hypothetical protein